MRPYFPSAPTNSGHSNAAAVIETTRAQTAIYGSSRGISAATLLMRVRATTQSLRANPSGNTGADVAGTDTKVAEVLAHLLEDGGLSTIVGDGQDRGELDADVREVFLRAREVLDEELPGRARPPPAERLVE